MFMDNFNWSSNSDNSLGIGGGIFILYVTVLALAMYYTIIGTSFQNQVIGTLSQANVYINSGNQNGNSYYRTETFKYTMNGNIPALNATNTLSCTVTRPYYYMFYGSAQNAVSNTQLGTQRKLWIASYSQHVCSDLALKLYNMNIGVTLFSVIAFVTFITCVILLYPTLKNYYDRIRSY